MKVFLIIIACCLSTASQAFVPETSRFRPIRKPRTRKDNTNHLNSAEIYVDISSDDDTTSQSDTSSLSKHRFGMFDFPRHSHESINEILLNTEDVVKILHQDSNIVDEVMSAKRSMSPMMTSHDSIFANTYVDLGRVDTVGFDYDYTLVHYTDELLTLLYKMALSRLVEDRHYPTEMIESNLNYDSQFSIRGLAVDKKTGWICHLSYTHKVAVAWEGREKVSTSRIFKEYRGKRRMTPSERRARLKPLNDLFSMAECCLIADTIQFFKDREIDFCPSNVVTDILGSIRDTHLSGKFHRIVSDNPERYFDPNPHLKTVLLNLKDSGKRLIFASNSPYWYVDAGMKYVLGTRWMDLWDAVLVSAGKPVFYTATGRPFREVDKETDRVRFQKVTKFESGKVYSEGCIRELIRLMPHWRASNDKDEEQIESADALNMNSNMNSNVLYIGDSLFADLVDAKREFGWITAAVTPEVGFELDVQLSQENLLAERTIAILLNALRNVQSEMGTSRYTNEDSLVLDKLEKLVSNWRDRQTRLLGNTFGSVFRARYQPSLFAHSLRRYCDLYMNSVGSLRLYSPQHRFYPESDFRLLAHEIKRSTEVFCVETFDDVVEDT